MRFSKTIFVFALLLLSLGCQTLAKRDSTGVVLPVALRFAAQLPLLPPTSYKLIVATWWTYSSPRMLPIRVTTLEKKDGFASKLVMRMQLKVGSSRVT